MRTLFLSGIYLFFLISGFSSVFVFSLGYIWVDLFSPQSLADGPVGELPLSMIIGVAAIGGYLLFDRRDPPRPTLGLWLIVSWAIWITLTTLWAEVPAAAWEKWNWAIKTVAFSAFLPFVIRSRIQIEAMVLTIVLSLGGTLLAGGARTLLTGGGYQVKLGLASGNSGLAEGSTLATTAIAIIPLILCMRTHSLLLPKGPLRHWLCFGLIAAAVLTALGSFERTGLIALAVLAFCLWLRSRRKWLHGGAAAGVALAGLGAMSGVWYDRMATISTFRAEDSALTRIAVWLWTLHYAADHPLGGGFGVYLINHFEVPIAGTGDVLEITARAFHSIYFEILGEQGIVGLAIFAAMVVYLFASLRSVGKAGAASAEDAWLAGLAQALTISALIYLAGGAFVGIAFQPFFYYLFAGALSLHHFAARRDPRSLEAA